MKIKKLSQLRLRLNALWSVGGLFVCIASSAPGVLEAARAAEPQVPEYLYKIVSPEQVAYIGRQPKKDCFLCVADDDPTKPFRNPDALFHFVGAAERDEALALLIPEHNPEEIILLTEAQYTEHFATKSEKECARRRILQIETALLGGRYRLQEVEGYPGKQFFVYRDTVAGTVPLEALVRALVPVDCNQQLQRMEPLLGAGAIQKQNEDHPRVGGSVRIPTPTKQDLLRLIQMGRASLEEGRKIAYGPNVIEDNEHSSESDSSDSDNQNF